MGVGIPLAASGSSAGRELVASSCAASRRLLALSSVFGLSEPVVDAILIGAICTAVVALVAGSAMYSVELIHPRTVILLAGGTAVVAPAAVLLLERFGSFVPDPMLLLEPSAATLDALRIGAIVTGGLIGLALLVGLLVRVVDLVTRDHRSTVRAGLGSSIAALLVLSPGLFLLVGVPVALFVRFRVVVPLLGLLPICYFAFYPAFGDTPAEGNPAVPFMLTVLGSPVIAVAYGLATAAELLIRAGIGRLADLVVPMASLGGM